MKRKNGRFLLSILLLSGCGSITDNTTSILENSSSINNSTSTLPNLTSSTPIVSSPTLSSSSFYVEGYHQLCEGLYVNYLPSLYSDEFDVEFLLPDSNYELYYTLDCSTPVRTYTQEYTKPIPIRIHRSKNLEDYPLTTSVDGILANLGNDKCTSNAYNQNIQLQGKYILLPKQTVITIMLFNRKTKQVTHRRALTYILDPEHKINIPVISLSMPYKDWFGTDGFYNQIREEIEKRAHLEYYDISTDEYFYRNTQVKLGGNWTLGYPQRTLNLNFNKDENGDKNEAVKAQIFPNRQRRDEKGKVKSYTRFRLHNGGNAFEESIGFNDAFMQAIMENDHNVATTGYRPCIAYFNGEYWGVYSLREHYKKQYFSSHYGVDKDDVILYDLKGEFNVSEGDASQALECLNELRDYFAMDFHNDSVYEKFINDYFDINSFIDVILANAYCSNWDFIGNFNNLKMWRTYSINSKNPYADGKWRFVIHDLDFAFRENTNYLDKNVGNSYSRFFFLSQLLKNQKFKEQLYSRASELMTTTFAHERVIAILDQMVDELSPYIFTSKVRWGQSSNYLMTWKNEINNVKNCLEYKEKNFLNTLKDTLKQYE